MEARIDNRTQEEVTNSLAQSFPRGRLFKAVNIDGSNLRKLLTGLSFEIARIEQKISKDVYEAYFINEEMDGLLEEWESSLGIPDNCFSITGRTRDERIEQVIAKLTMWTVVTAQDHIDIAALLGFTITIEPLSESLYPAYSVPFTPVGSGTRFVAIVKGDNIAGGFPAYTPAFFPQGTFSVLECFFNILKPANVKYVYVNN